MCLFLLLFSFLLLYFFFFTENRIKSACLNTAQNLISDINSQNENFVTLTKRLVEVRDTNSRESIPYGII